MFKFIGKKTAVAANNCACTDAKETHRLLTTILEVVTKESDHAEAKRLEEQNEVDRAEAIREMRKAFRDFRSKNPHRLNRPISVRREEDHEWTQKWLRENGYERFTQPLQTN